ncbi:MAG: trypsin-like peptidase domain-containing protein [Lachnospiraceae bacterium]|nr:trypsin-like peptidase domain-containing protein [Lachnospiraceae bacterium]
MSEENRIWNEQTDSPDGAASGETTGNDVTGTADSQQPSWQTQPSQETQQATGQSFYDANEPIWKSMDIDGLDTAADVYGRTQGTDSRNDSAYGNVSGNGTSGSTYGNSYGQDASGSVYGSESAGNTYGNGSAGSTYGNGQSGDIYGNGSAGSTYGNGQSGNTYGNGPAGSTYGSGQSGNTYGNGSAGSTYGNTYGNGAEGSQSGNGYGRNVWGSGSQQNTYGNSPAGNGGSYGGGNYGGGNGNSGDNGSKKKKGHGIQIAAVCIIAVVVMAVACIYAIDKYGTGTEQTANNETSTGGSSEAGTDVTIDTTDTTENQVNLTVSDTEDTSTGVFITDVSDVVEEVMPAIVAITSTTIVESGSYGPFSSGTYEAVGAGSGIIIGQTDTELLIVTNNHVVSDATSLEVQFIDESSVTAYTKATSSDNDIAVVSVLLSDMDEDTLDAIKIATLGNSDELRVGEGIIAIGNALGYGQSVTVGVVSALNREVTTDEGTTQVMIQLDAAINGGNSGGALLNKYGEVVGINSAKYSSTDTSSASIEGMGFAIPISDVIDVIEELMNTETRYKVDDDERGYLGVSGGDITEQMNLYFGYPMGFYIQSVVEGGAAEEAGIQAGDIIVGFAGTEITSYSELSELMQYYAVGETVTVTVARANDDGEFEEIDIEVTLCENLAE